MPAHLVPYQGQLTDSWPVYDCCCYRYHVLLLCSRYSEDVSHCRHYRVGDSVEPGRVESLFPYLMKGKVEFIVYKYHQIDQPKAFIWVKWKK